MPGNLDAYKQSSGNFDLDDNDDVSTFDDNLDLAYLLQQMADEGPERQGLDMDTCLQTYGQNSLLCTEILEKSKVQEKMNTVPCSTQTCIDRFASLFKHDIKRSRQNECKSVGCRVSQYVKKSFCNRYGCGRRRKKTDKESQLSGISDVYPVWESTKDSLILSDHDVFPVARSNTFRENQPRDDFRRIPPLCGITFWWLEKSRIGAGESMTDQTPAEDLSRSSKLRAHACGTSVYDCQKGRRNPSVRNTESLLYQYFKRLQSSRNTKQSTAAVVNHPSNINNEKKAVPSKTLHLADNGRQLDDSKDPLPVSRSDNFRRNQQSDDLKSKSIHVPVCGTDDSECQRGKPLKPKHN